MFMVLWWLGAARRLKSTPHCPPLLQTALAALSGIQELPEARSLLTLEEGLVTLQMMSEPGRITRPAHISAVVGRVLGAEHRDWAAKVGKIRMLQEEGGQLEGGAFDVPPELAKLLLAKEGELRQRSVFLTQPSNLPPEEDLYSSSRDAGGRRGGFNGGDDAFWERRRMQQGRNGGGRRDDFGGGGGGSRGAFGGGRGGGNGGGRREWEDRGGRGGSSRFSGERERRGSFGDKERRDGFGGGRGGSRGGGRSWDAAADWSSSKRVHTNSSGD